MGWMIFKCPLVFHRLCGQVQLSMLQSSLQGSRANALRARQAFGFGGRNAHVALRCVMPHCLV